MYFKKPVRRNQLISPWGIGSIINFPKDETLMVAGLDEWEIVYRQANEPEEFTINEERLAQRLGVEYFKLPPDFREPEPGSTNSKLKIPFVCFPLWYYCPRCGTMEKLSLYKNEPPKCKGQVYSSGMSCHLLNEKKRPGLIPSRFLAVCPEGHIEDFPFIEWVHENALCSNPRLRLRAGRSSSSLTGIKIECTSCKKYRTMAGAFNIDSLEQIKRCSGQRPWLGEIGENANPCPYGKLSVVQRGGANVYFPQIRSAIYLPQWKSSIKRRVLDVLEKNWNYLTLSGTGEDFNFDVFNAFSKKYNLNVDELLIAAREKIQITNKYINNSDSTDLEELHRKTEYKTILKGEGGENQDFFVTNIDRTRFKGTIKKYFKSISLLHKLRETRAFVGFSRLIPENEKTIDELRANLSLSNQINWLPAIIVKGEGILFEFDNLMIENWKQNADIQLRYNLLNRNYAIKTRKINPKFLLIHTFAHIIINQFSLVCGYGSSALRERIYCDCDPETPEDPMNGVLIYTASGDWEGSLDGLVRQGNPGYLENIVESALYAAQWCSADPICIDSMGQGPDNCNLAACHNCALLPETCCELGNRLLDRAFLIGKINRPEIGFFYEFNE